MSGTGIGGEILALAFLVPAAGVYIAGKTLIGVVKFGIAAGGAIYEAHKKHEEKRREEMRRELEKLEGGLAKAALERHDALAKAQTDIEAACERAHAERIGRMNAAADRLEAAGRSAEEAMHSLPAYFTACEMELEESVKRETDRFTEELDKVCRVEIENVRKAVEGDAEKLGVQLDRAEGMLDERDEKHRVYALKALGEGRELLAALEAGYDASLLAPGEIAQARVALMQLEKNIADGNYATAAMTGGRFVQQVATLHLVLEQNTARFNRMKMELDRAAAEMDAVEKGSHELAGEDATEDIRYYVDEECDAAFWSEGRLPRLWKRAEELRKRVEAFGYRDMEMARAWLIEIRTLRMKIEAEHARARQHVASRVAVDQLVASADESMAETGWTRSEEPEYVMLNPATGSYEVCDDPRGAVRLRYTNGQGDERTIIVCNEYDPMYGTYVQNFMRFCNESGTPDEGARAQADIAFNKAIAERLELPEDAGIKCDKNTAGTKARG